MMRNELILTSLGEAAAEGADSELVAVHTVLALTLLQKELTPLVGRLAMRALHVRSLHLARASFQRPETNDCASPDEFLTPLHRDLASRPAPQALAAAVALLSAPANLLASLIGEPLTDRLLHKAWSDPGGATPKQVKQP